MKLRSSKAACCLGATLVVMMMPVLPKVTDAKPTYEQHESTITDTEVRVASYAANVEEVILTGYEEQQGQMQNKALAITEPYLDVYSADDENSSVNGRLYKNTVVDVLEVNGSMTKISSGNCEGYIKTAALLFNQEAEVIAQTLDEKDILTGYYPNSITGVIYQKSQFSGASDGAGGPSAKFQNRLNSGIRTQECMDAALEALSGKNNIGGYTSFRMVSITNLSAMSDYVIIGGHVFH